MIILFSIVFSLVNAIIIDPVNKSCIYNSNFTKEQHEKLGVALHYFDLPPFSQSIIQVDLRHLSEIPKDSQGQTYFHLKAQIIQGESVFDEVFTDVKPKTNKFKFFVDKQTKLGLYFEIAGTYQAYKYLLYQSISMQTILQNLRMPSEGSSFLFIVSSYDSISLPLNRPNAEQYKGYYIDSIPLELETSSSDNIESANSYWTVINNIMQTFNNLAIPFIPYISGCQGEGKKMYLNQLMENETDCLLVSTEDTIPIDQFKFGSTPKADSCSIIRQCIYNQVPGLSAQFPYWLNLPEGTNAFYITKNKVNYTDYQINTQFDSNQLVPCQIKQSKGANTSDSFPLNVKLQLDYYQVSKQEKRMISCSISFSLYLSSTKNFAYQFQLSTNPLNHTYIMLAFGFQQYVYMIIFLIIGVISNFENLVLWLFHSCVSRKEKKYFRIKIYIKIIIQIAMGTILGLIFCLLLVFSITLIMNGKIFQTTLYSANENGSKPRVFWDYLNNNYIGDYDSNEAVMYRAGRMGLSFVVSATVILFYISTYFIGCEKKANEYYNYQVMGRQLKPREWNRGKFIFGIYVYITIQFFLIYFAYSTLYSSNIWTFIVLTKVIQIFMEQITKSIYEDILQCLPMKVLTQITAYMNTLSANNFYDFLFSFLIDVAFTMVEKAYFSQLQNTIVDNIHIKIGEFLKFYAHLINDVDGEINQRISQKMEEQQEQNQFILMNGQAQQVKFFDNDQVELYNDDNEFNLCIDDKMKKLSEKIHHELVNYRKNQNKINSQNHNNELQEHQNEKLNENEMMEEESKMFELLMDNILLLFTFILQPFTILVYWVTYDESAILSNYGITSDTVILYLLSAIVIAIFTIINVIIIFHLLQSYLEKDFEEQIVNQLQRFASRKIFWKASDEDINKKIQMQFRGAYHYCLSWQLFFILTICICSMIFVILGISIMINVKYNPFKDVTAFLIMFFWYCFVNTIIWLGQAIGYKINLDGWADFDNNQKNINAIVDYQFKELSNNNNKQENQIENETVQSLLVNFSSNQQLVRRKNTLKLYKLASKIETDEPKIQNNQPQIEQQCQDGEDILEADEGSEEALQIKLNTICKKLQQKFDDGKFSMNYFKKHKKYIRSNIDKILPLMNELPQISEYRILSNCHTAVEFNSKKESKNYDISVIEIMRKWKAKTDELLAHRQKQGKQSQRKLSACSFCQSTWGLYYGYNGMCLQCAKTIYPAKKIL